MSDVHQHEYEVNCDKVDDGEDCVAQDTEEMMGILVEMMGEAMVCLEEELRVVMVCLEEELRVAMVCHW